MGQVATKTFFAVVPPGLEAVAAEELKAWAPELIFEKQKGGLSWSGDMRQAVNLQASLKIPSRVLMRVAEVAARDFPKRYKKVGKIP